MNRIVNQITNKDKGLDAFRLKPSSSFLSLAVLSVGMGGAVSSYAQDGRSAQALEEIVVTATRREESLQSIAASITAVSGADLDSRGTYDFKEVAEAISGLDLVQPEGFVSSAIYIRGVGTAGNSGADTSVGVIVDGVYQLKLGAAFTELLDIERVEVLRGPQGTLFGKNTTAGLVRIETAKPNTEEFSGRLQGVAGNLEARELRGLVNIPIIEGQLAARISAFTAERDGYTNNNFTGEDTRNVDREGWRAKVLWQPADFVELLLSAENIEQSARMDQGLVEYSDDFINRFGDILPPIGVGNYQQQSGGVNDEIDRYVLTTNWELPNHTLTTISAYEEVVGTILTDQDFTILGPELGPGFITYITNTADTTATTHEVQITSNWEGPLNYIVGAFTQNEELVSSTNLFFGGSTTPLIRPPSLRDVDSTAVFGNITYDITDSLDTSIGARYTEDEKQGANNVFNGIETFREWTYSLKMRYHFADDKMVYVSHDKGFKSGGINREFNLCGRLPGALCLDESTALWQPETSYNYELGVKTQWLDNRVRLNAALFLQTFEDYQVTQTIPGEGTSLITNAAEVEATGLEADFIWLLGENFTFSGNLAYIETEYEEYENAPCATPTSVGCSGGVQDLSGSTLDNAPKLTYSLAGEYRNAITSVNNMEWFGRLELVYKDDHNLFVLLPTETKQSNYHLVNARVGLESPDSWRASFWARNLTDEEYLTSGQLANTGLRLTPGVPRTYGVTVDWFF